MHLASGGASPLGLAHVVEWSQVVGGPVWIAAGKAELTFLGSLQEYGRSPLGVGVVEWEDVAMRNQLAVDV